MGKLVNERERLKRRAARSLKIVQERSGDCDYAIVLTSKNGGRWLMARCPSRAIAVELRAALIESIAAKMLDVFKKMAGADKVDARKN